MRLEQFKYACEQPTKPKKRTIVMKANETIADAPNAMADQQAEPTESDGGKNEVGR
jgi:erythromycin esterase-like protein